MDRVAKGLEELQARDRDWGIEASSCCDSGPVKRLEEEEEEGNPKLSTKKSKRHKDHK